MSVFKKSPENPILIPEGSVKWKAVAAFNPSVVTKGSKLHMLFRAESTPQEVNGATLEMSTIGIAESKDWLHFQNQRQFIKPEHEWEKYGCEDPRITKIGGKFYIFYTALSQLPFRAEGIRVGVAISKDLKTIEEKHLVTPFNAKAMAMFPEKINGKYAVIFSAHTDSPPAKTSIALFDKIEDMWSETYWETWHANIDEYTVPLQRSSQDHVEIGAPPIKTKDGWLILYSYIENYFTPHPTFTVAGALLNLKDPKKIIGHTERTLLLPDEEYELYGRVPNIVFPSGAAVKRGKIYLYYGAADTVCAVSEGNLKDTVEEIKTNAKVKLKRYEGNPIIEPNPNHSWESKATFNPTAIYEKSVIHIIYRAMSEDNTSTMGYATSKNGFEIEERYPEPIYTPREDFEKKFIPNGNSGAEDGRITKIGDKLYMCYTAYNGKDEPRVALTSILLSDFLKKNWNWEKPKLISPPGESDKDAALFPKKINGKYVFLHRIGGTDIWIDFVDDLESLGDKKWLKGSILMSPRLQRWDSKRIGIAGPPIETKHGWLLLYHGIAKDGSYYRAKAALLDLKDPRKVLARTTGPIIEPETQYEREGEVKNVVFPCGAVVKDGELIVYYGGADKVTGVASIKLKTLLGELLKEAKN